MVFPLVRENVRSPREPEMGWGEWIWAIVVFCLGEDREVLGNGEGANLFSSGSRQIR